MSGHVTLPGSMGIASGRDPGEAPAIARRERMGPQDRTDFAALRQEAIALAQAASGRTWTDYNLHDPGLTILEAVCYAMTELSYRAAFPVADHLSEQNGDIDWNRQGLYRPEAIFPCRPTTESDLRLSLLDQVRVGSAPALTDVYFKPAAAEDPAAGNVTIPLGLYRIAVLPAATDTGITPETIAPLALAAYRRHRNLGEDLDEAIAVVGIVYYRLKLTASLEGPREPLDVVAEAYDRVAERLESRSVVDDLASRLAAGLPLEQIYAGPVMHNGFISPRPLDETISFSALRRDLLDVKGIAEVTAFELLADVQSDSSPATSRTLSWQSGRSVPRLRLPRPVVPGGSPPDKDPDLSLLTLKRRGAELTLDNVALAERLSDRRAGRQRARRTATVMSPEMPMGTYRRNDDYYALRHHLPPIYGIGGTEPPQAGSPAEQLTAYLSLFDQALADEQAQIRHIRDLFAVDASSNRTYWRELPDPGLAPGLEQLCAGSDAKARLMDALAEQDDAAGRQDRVLDYLLALYGETYTQNTMRQFLDYLDAAEQRAALLVNKRAYLRDFVVLGRDRAGAFDYGQPLWSSPDQTPGALRRLALLLGFDTVHARRLAPAALLAGKGTAEPEPSPSDGWQPVQWPDQFPDGPDEPFPDAPPAAALFECGPYRRRYSWRPEPGRDDVRLALGPDRNGAWWDLGAFPTASEAAERASRLRRTVLALTDMSDGLHAVEHILLRPRTQDRSWAAADHNLRVTLVLPTWTARCRRDDFREFVTSTARIAFPAHLAIDTVWLDVDAMSCFERCYALWLQALVEHAGGAGEAATLDGLAEKVLTLIGTSQSG